MLAQKAVEEVVFFELRDVVLVVFGALLFGRVPELASSAWDVFGGWFVGERRQRDGTTGGQSNPQKPIP